MTGGFNMLEYKYDTQLLIDGANLDEDAVHDYIIAVSYTHLSAA